MLKQSATLAAALLGSALLMQPSLTAAAQWFSFNSSAYGQLLADKDSVVKSGDSVKLWAVQAPLKLNPGQAVYSKVLYAFNCHEHQYQVFQVTSYDRDGQSSDLVLDSAVKNVIPDSREDSLEQFACKPANGWWTPVSHVPESLAARVRAAKEGFFD